MNSINENSAAQNVAQSQAAQQQSTQPQASTTAPFALQTVAIIGWGCAGVNAAIALRTHGYSGEIIAFSAQGGEEAAAGKGVTAGSDSGGEASEQAQGIAPYSPMLTSYFAGGEKTLGECYPWDPALLGTLNVQVIAEGAVQRLDVGARIIQTPKATHTYTKCIIASGATPTTAGFPECEYTPLTLRTISDAKRLKAALCAPACKRVLISGAGMVGLKIAEAALAQNKSTDIVCMGEHVLAANAYPAPAARFEAGLHAQGINLRMGCVIDSVKVNGSELLVTFSDGTTGTFDEIAVAHGVRPNLEFVAAGTLEGSAAGLKVNECMQTSNPDVYAAGDVALTTNLITGQALALGTWVGAVAQGRVAGAQVARALAGGEGSSNAPDETYKGGIPSNTMQVGNLLFISGGVTSNPENTTLTGALAGATPKLEIEETPEMTVAKLFATAPTGEKTLIGFNVVEDACTESDTAFDTAAMLLLQLESAFK